MHLQNNRKLGIWIVEDLKALLLMFLGVMIKLWPGGPYLLEALAAAPPMGGVLLPPCLTQPTT